VGVENRRSPPVLFSGTIYPLILISGREREEQSAHQESPDQQLSDTPGQEPMDVA